VSFVEFSPAVEGFVLWRTNFTSQGVTGGTGFLDVSGASWVRDAVGRDRAQGYYLAGRGSFVNGTISFPFHE
jgi:hypothetical protein